MEITDVKVKLVEDRSDKLLAFCTITIDDDFVIRDLKIIEGPKGAFVAMPSRKLTDRCPRCSGKNHRLSKFCNNCGAKLSESRSRRGDGGRTRLHADIAHPITSECREFLQKKVLAAFEAERERSTQEGYIPPDLDADFAEEKAEEAAASRRKQSSRREPATREPERREAEPQSAEVAGPSESPPPPPPAAEPSRPDRPPRRRDAPPRERAPVKRQEPVPPPAPPSSSEDSDDNFSSGIFR